MNWFTASTESDGIVSASRATVWRVLTDPSMLAELTPLLERIEPFGEHWRWHFSPVPILGQRLTPSFTERMTFRPQERIDYRHEPPADRVERAGVDGWYTLADVPGGTHLAIGLTVKVQLPLGRFAAPAVTRVLEAVMARTGAGFEANFVRRLEQLSA